MTTLLTMKWFNKTVTPITTAGIYHSPSLWLISLSSDWTNWITIADKNLGATQVYNSGDTLSEANCGKCYQWWNNYGFPYSWSISPTSSSQVNAQNYWPWYYYSSSTWVYWNTNWANPTNNNLWWWVTWTNEAMQWPCDNGYHIPNSAEWENLKDMWKDMWAWGDTSWNKLVEYLKMALLWWRNYQSPFNRVQENSTWSYRLSETLSGRDDLWKVACFTNDSITYALVSQKAWASAIRPFKNTPVQPDDWWDWDTLYTPPEPLCFTANTAGSMLRLIRVGSPNAVTLETSTDWQNWSAYTFGTLITLSNVWDKVYWRNTSEATTKFSLNTNNRYYFATEWSIAASWDLGFLLNKNSTTSFAADDSGYTFYNLFYYCTALTTPPEMPQIDTLIQYCYNRMFIWCSNLTKAPKLPATTLANYCYQAMFSGCSNLEELPELPAITLKNYCYQIMFNACSKIKISTTQTWEYQNEYRIPTTWTWTTATNALTNMFNSTWWTFTSDPSINTTYYTSNQVI